MERLARIEYGGMGSDIGNQMAVEHFERSVEDPALRQRLLLVGTSTLDDAVKSAEKFRIVGQSSRETTASQSRGHSNRIATVDSGNLDTSVEKSKIEGLLISIEKKMNSYGDMIKENNDRLSALESQKKSVKKCYRCYYLIKNCPLSKSKSNKKSTEITSKN